VNGGYVCFPWFVTLADLQLHFLSKIRQKLEAVLNVHNFGEKGDQEAQKQVLKNCRRRWERQLEKRIQPVFVNMTNYKDCV
jgi:hypothetical protein